MNSPHPELEALAELADPAAVDTSDAHAQLLAHVAECAICTGDLDALRGVRETLRTLPPVPMPADLAERLEAALLAARAEDQADAERSNVTPLVARSARPAGRGRWASVPFGAAAAVVVVLALGTAAVIGISHNAGDKKSSTTAAAPSTTSAAGGLAPGAPVVTSGTSYTSADLRSQVTAVITSSVPGAAQRYDALRNPDFAAGSSAAASAPFPAAAPAASSAPAAATSAAGTNSAPSPPPAAAVASSAPTLVRTTPGGPLADPAALARCVQILAPGQDHALVLVDYATFNGVPSTIIVLADPAVPGKLDVYVESDKANCDNQELTYAAFLDPPASQSP